MLNDTKTISTERHSPVPSGAVLRFDLAAEARALRCEAAWSETGHNAKTLLRQSDLRLVLIELRAGVKLQEHKTANRITVQTLAGHIRLNLPDAVVDLPAPGMLVLDKGIPHDVVAEQDSSILLTIGWDSVAHDRERASGG